MAISTEFLFTALDIVGTFVFALSGAQAAKEAELDIFGTSMIAFVTACGGGIARDLCLGITPPVGISHWPYLALTVLALLAVALFSSSLQRLQYPVLIFDAAGLAMFTVAGTQKSLFLQYNYEVAILLGVFSAVGGGILRDLLLGKVPMVLRKEVYASAALVGALIVAGFHFAEWSANLGAWVGLLVCFTVRFLAMKRRWNLPRI